ncbi:MAG: hypothetical protein QGG46_00690 [Gammaproteobacteria bacterium]|jgi:hypothetical protein|nr:hypothetical protein [Gammaproteobacteria bacterium]
MTANIIPMLLAQPFLLFVVITALLVILARTKLWVPAPADGLIPPIVALIFASVVILHLGYALAYLFAPVYFDHIEPNTAAVAYLFNRGEPVYHEIDAAPRYSMLYGPAHYVLNGFSYRLFGHSDTAFKLTGVLCLLTTFGFVGWSVRRIPDTRLRDVLTGLGLVAALALFFRNYSFWSKSDSIMMAFVALGVFSCFCRRPVLAAVICGIGLGVTMNGKLHGIAYYLPLIALHFQRDRWRSLFVIGGVSFLIALAPFVLFGNISLPNYLNLVRSAGAHGIGPAILLQNALTALFLLLPLVCLLVYSGRAGSVEWLRNNRLVVFAGTIGVLLIVIAGAKPGSGPYHLLPFLPAIAVLSVVFYKQAQQRGATAGFWIPFCSFILVAVIKAVYSAGFGIALVAKFEQPLLVIDDLQQIVAANPGKNIHMGYGDGTRYPRTFYRTQLVFAGKPYLLDAAALMDFDFSGVKIPKATLAAMNEDPDALWLIPRDQQPFTLKSWLQRFDEDGFLFDAGFRRNFQDRFVLRETSGYYDLWVPR